MKTFSNIVAIAALTWLLASCTTTEVIETNAAGNRINKDSKIDYDRAVQNHSALAIRYMRDGNWDRARLHIDKAFEIDKNSPLAHNAQALLYEQQGEMELAETHFEKAISADSKYTSASFNYGGFLLREERYEDCYRQFERTTKDLKYTNRAAAFAYMGRCADLMGRPERSKALYERSLNIDPSQTVALIELAEIFFTEQNYAQSRGILDQFEALVPRKSARSLWLGIRIERIFGNKDKEASYVLQLKQFYPYSSEYLEYKNSK